MYCKKCGVEIAAGEYCNSCKAEVERVATLPDKVSPAVTKKLLLFGILGLVPLANLFVNIIELTVLDESEGFSFYSFISTIADFKCFDGTEGYIFLSMFLMLVGAVKLLAASINALKWSARRDKLKKAYTGLYKWCEGFGILSLIAMGVNYYGYSSVFKDKAVLGVSLDEVFKMSIPAPFVIISVLSIVLGVVIKVFYSQDKNECL